jgi:flagellar motor component MotA
MNTVIFKKALIVAALVGLLYCVFAVDSDIKLGMVDGKAALLVLVAPLLLVLLLQKHAVPMHLIGQALSGSKDTTPQDLLEATQAIASGTGAARIARMSDNHADPLVRYGASLLSSHFQKDEIAELLSRKIETQDEQWHTLHSLCAFMAKMSPYFGMLATVVGLVQLLNRLEDFSKISGGMALAMQGTLFGLVSFTLVYAPLQRFIQTAREDAFRRNTGIARWFLLVAQKADPMLITEELNSTRAVQRAISEPRGISPLTRKES